MKKSFITKLLTAITVVASSLFIGTACEPEHTHNFVPTVTPATCTESGYTTYNCECGEDSYVGDNTSALGHNYQNYVSNNDATYLQDGTETGRCIRCNRTHTRNDSGTKLASSWEFDGLEEVEEDEAYKVDGKLSNATTTYNLDEKIVKVGYTYKVFKGDDEVTDSQALPLTEGENEFTVKNYLNDVEQDTYVVTIYRKKMFTVTFDTKGGSTIDSVQVEEDAKVSAPTDPTKTGYVFSSWNHVFETPITSNITIEASWNAGIVNYTVEYYLEQLDGTFVKADAETETKQGTTDASVTAVPKTTINHFTFDENNAENALTATVNADGSTVFKAYFARNSYTVTFKDGEATLKEETVKYGASATAPTPTKDGYTLGWDVAFDNVAGNLTVNTEWTPKTDTPYVVEYYLERLDGTIVRNSIDNFKGTTDATVEADTTVAFAGQTFDANNELNVLSATVKADGSTVLKVYYTRNSHTVTFSFTEGELVGGDLVQTVKYEGDATAPIVKRDGYDLSWDASYSHVTSDLTINAVWTAKTDIAYKVEYYLEKLDGTFEKADTQNKQGTTDATVEADTTVTFDHFTFDATKDEELSATVNADGSTVLKVYYARNSYTVTFKNGEETVEETVKYEGSATAPTLTKTGYDLSWDIEFINVSSDITVNAVRTAKTNIAYKVEYYYENLDGNYDKLATENKQGTTDTEVTADVEVGNKPHYTFDEDNELNVLTDDALNGDGTTVLKVYYNLNEYTVKFTVKEREGETVETVSQNNMKYGATLTSPTYKVEGYIAVWTNVNWDAEVVDGVINFYTEAWRVTGDNFYTVKTYKESEDGVFDEISSQVVENMPVDISVEAEYTLPAGYELDDEQSVITGVVVADNSLVLKVYFKHLRYTVTFDVNGGELKEGELVQTVKYLNDATAPVVERAGYTLGWDVAFDNVTSNLTVTAVWSPITVTYTVKYYKENLQDSEFTYVEEETINVEYSENLKFLPIKEYEGFTVSANEYVVEDVLSGNAVVEVNFVRKTYTVTFKNGEDTVKEEVVKYQGSATAPILEEVVGYIYTWDATFDNVTDNLVINAQWEGIDFTFKVEYYYEAVEGGYEKAPRQTEIETAKYSDDFTFTVTKEVAGFAVQPGFGTFDFAKLEKGKDEDKNPIYHTVEEVLSGEIVLKVYFYRLSYTVTFMDGEEEVGTATVKYERSAEVPVVNKNGYHAICNEDLSSITEDTVIQVEWAENEATLNIVVWANDGSIGTVNGGLSFETTITTGQVFDYELVECEGKNGCVFMYFTEEAWFEGIADAPAESEVYGKDVAATVAEHGSTITIYAYFYYEYI